MGRKAAPVLHLKLRIIPFHVGNFPNILPNRSNCCDGLGRALVSACRCKSTTGFDRPTTSPCTYTRYGGSTWGTSCAPSLRSPRSVNPRTAATLLFDSKSVAARLTLELTMRKMVPDPPHSLDSTQALQDTLVQSSEYVLCALFVARQSVQLKPTHRG